MQTEDGSLDATAYFPRSTSYPTGPHFRPLEKARYRASLARMKPAERLSLHVHIPFCHELAGIAAATPA
jgi:oxygen-independent coproporphyrinogen-3 oxidase